MGLTDTPRVRFMSGSIGICLILIISAHPIVTFHEPAEGSVYSQNISIPFCVSVTHVLPHSLVLLQLDGKYQVDFSHTCEPDHKTSKFRCSIQAGLNVYEVGWHAAAVLIHSETIVAASVGFKVAQELNANSSDSTLASRDHADKYNMLESARERVAAALRRMPPRKYSIHVIGFDRPDATVRLIRSLAAADYRVKVDTPPPRDYICNQSAMHGFSNLRGISIDLHIHLDAPLETASDERKARVRATRDIVRQMIKSSQGRNKRSTDIPVTVDEELDALGSRKHRDVGDLVWPHGKVVSHLRVRHGGVLAQRLEAWNPHSTTFTVENSVENLEWLADWERFEVANRQVAAFFEDDLEVSPLWFQWLQRALIARDGRLLIDASELEHRTAEMKGKVKCDDLQSSNELGRHREHGWASMYGVCMQRNWLVTSRYLKDLTMQGFRNGHQPYFYPVIGPLGTVVLGGWWQRFVTWVGEQILDPAFTPTVPGSSFTNAWVHPLPQRSKGRAELWTNWMDRFAYDTNSHCLYPNLPRGEALVMNIGGPGLHYAHEKGNDSRLVDVERRWTKERLYHIPEVPTLVTFSGHDHRLHKNAYDVGNSTMGKYKNDPIGVATEILLSSLRHPLDKTVEVKHTADLPIMILEEFLDLLLIRYDDLVSHAEINPTSASISMSIDTLVASLCTKLDETSLIALVGFPKNDFVLEQLNSSQNDSAFWCGDYSPMLGIFENEESKGHRNMGPTGSVILRRRSYEAHGSTAIEARYMSLDCPCTVVEFLDERYGMIQDLRVAGGEGERVA